MFLVEAGIFCQLGQKPREARSHAYNEYGAAASAKLYGVEILNEGFGSSVDDSVLEMQATFVARSVAPLQAVGRTSLLKSWTVILFFICIWSKGDG